MAERPLVARIRRILNKEEQTMQVSRKAVGLVLAGLLTLAVLIAGYYSLPSYADDAESASKESLSRATTGQQAAEDRSTAADDEPRLTATIAGKVTDAQTGKPMAEVRVPRLPLRLTFSRSGALGQNAVGRDSIGRTRRLYDTDCHIAVFPICPEQPGLGLRGRHGGRL